MKISNLVLYTASILAAAVAVDTAMAANADATTTNNTITVTAANANTLANNLAQCLTDSGVAQVFTPATNVEHFDAQFEHTVQNKRFAKNRRDYRPPMSIVVPTTIEHVQAAVKCAVKTDVLLRIRCGGHGYEGFAMRADSPYLLLDLQKLNNKTIDVANKRAVVQGGSSLGELYYEISQRSNTLAFSGGSCHSVGTGGHIQGGGFGLLSRKYGLAADNVLAMKIVDAAGDVRDVTPTTNADLYWALRGAGGGSFGVVVEYTLRLVDVPAVVSMVSYPVDLLPADAAKLFNWVHDAPRELTAVHHSALGQMVGLWQGSKDSFLAIVPDFLDKAKFSIKEMSWINSVRAFDADDLTDRRSSPNYKRTTTMMFDSLDEAKVQALHTALTKFSSNSNVASLFISLDPLGGRIADLGADATPFAGRTSPFLSQVIATYKSLEDPIKQDDEAVLAFFRALHSDLRSANVSNARGYTNYQDIQFGVNPPAYTAADRADLLTNPAFAFGVRYYGEDNFVRLAAIKTAFDPTNVFRHPQSVPLLASAN